MFLNSSSNVRYLHVHTVFPIVAPFCSCTIPHHVPRRSWVQTENSEILQLFPEKKRQFLPVFVAITIFSIQCFWRQCSTDQSSCSLIKMRYPILCKPKTIRLLVMFHCISTITGVYPIYPRICCLKLPRKDIDSHVFPAQLPHSFGHDFVAQRWLSVVFEQWLSSTPHAA